MRITPSTVTTDGVRYPRWYVSYFEGAKRVRVSHSDEQKAKTHAEFVASKLASGEVEASRMTTPDRVAYGQALGLIRELGRNDLIGFIRESVEAMKLLPPSMTLREAVGAHIKRTASLRERRTVPDLVKEFVKLKETAGLSERHLADLRSRLTAFSAAFRCPADEITAPLLQAYLDKLNGAARTKLNHWRHIITFFRWGVKRKLVPRDMLEELESIEKPKPVGGEVGVFTPAQLSEMLEAVRIYRPDLIAWVAVAAFCGLRTAEILRLDWSKVNIEKRHVEVTADMAKTASRRLTPLCDAAITWLQMVPSREGPVSPYSEENKALAAIMQSVGKLRKERERERASAVGEQPKPVDKFKWVRNGMRHSFCTYRLEVIQDAAKVSLEAGNSTTMLFRNYRELSTKQEADAWFGVMPAEQPANVIPMKEAV